jgi:uroporphyrinogen-III synthase
VVSRAELCGVLPSRALPGGAYGRPQADEHAVEMAVARLRRGLGGGGLVETVVKRGYRLACDPVFTGSDVGGAAPSTSSAEIRPAP